MDKARPDDIRRNLPLFMPDRTRPRQRRTGQGRAGQGRLRLQARFSSWVPCSSKARHPTINICTMDQPPVEWCRAAATLRADVLSCSSVLRRNNCPRYGRTKNRKTQMSCRFLQAVS